VLGQRLFIPTPVSGSAVGQGSASASLSPKYLLTASGAAQASSTGALLVRLSGSSLAQAASTSAPRLGLSSSTVAQAVSTSAPRLGLSGATTAQASSAAALQQSVALSGASGGGALVSANLLVKFAATTLAGASSTAALAGSAALSGSSAGQATTTSAPKLGLSSVAAAQATSTTAPRLVLTGNSVAQASSAATLSAGAAGVALSGSSVGQASSASIVPAAAPSLALTNQSNPTQGIGAASVTSSPSFTSVGGRLLVAGATSFTGLGPGIPPFSDGGTNTWVNSSSPYVAPLLADIAYAKNITGKSGEAVTYTIAQSAYPSVCLLEFSGCDPSTPELSAPQWATTSGTSVDSALLTPAAGWCLLVTVGHANYNPVAQITPIGTGTAVWTTFKTDAYGGEPILLAYAIVNATGTATYGVRFSAGGSGTHQVGIAAYKAAVAGGVGFGIALPGSTLAQASSAAALTLSQPAAPVALGGSSVLGTPLTLPGRIILAAQPPTPPGLRGVVVAAASSSADLVLKLQAAAAGGASSVATLSGIGVATGIQWGGGAFRDPGAGYAPVLWLSPSFQTASGVTVYWYGGAFQTSP
jgi:hypothetical protein